MTEPLALWCGFVVGRHGYPVHEGS